MWSMMGFFDQEDSSGECPPGWLEDQGGVSDQCIQADPTPWRRLVAMYCDLLVSALYAPGRSSGSLLGL